MKTPLLLAALLLAAPAAANAQNSSLAGSEDPNMSGSTKRMFIINATTPGALTFSGAGTATFNNAVGTNNQFNVGSTTSIGVEASVSATQEFDGLASGVMQMGEGSNLMQTNGTSTAAASIQAAAVAANSVAIKEAETVAHDVGFEKATEVLGGGYQVNPQTGLEEWKAPTGSPYFYPELTGDYGTFNTAGEFIFNDGKYSQDFDDLSDAKKETLVFEWYYYGDTSSISDSMTDSQTREAELDGARTAWSNEQQDYRTFKNAYKTESHKAYDSAYQNSFNNVIAKSALNISESTETGQIKGTFTTTSDTTTSIGTAAQLDAIAASALKTATATGDSVGGTSWTAAFNQAYGAGYESSIGNSTVNTDSEVLVVGLGAIASVNTDTNSIFTVNLDRLEAFKGANAQENSSATANGAATSTLSTNSFATQNSQRTASAFMQAFAANEDVSSTSSSN